MQYEEILLTLAEVSVTIAGFSGVVIVLGGRRNPEKHQANAARTQGMVLGALQAVAYSILPLIVSESGVEPETAWRVACALFGLGHGVGTAFFFVRFRRLPGYEAAGVAPLLWVLAVSFSGLLLAAAAGAFGSFAAVVYMAALLNTLGQATYGFLQLLSIHLSDAAW